MKFWDAKFKANEISFILDKIRSSRVVEEDGRVSYSTDDYEDWVAVLVSAVGFEVRTDALRSRIVQGALFASKLPANFTEADFRGEAYSQRHKWQNTKQESYRVAFHIWNQPFFLNGMHRIDEVSLNFSPSKKTPIFKKILKGIESQRSHKDFKFLFTEENLQDLKRCSICLTHVKASTPEDAYQRASEALYELLGLTNLALDSAKISRTSFRIRGKLPVSEVLIGPQTTVHFQGGDLAFDGFWHDTWVGGPNKKSRSADYLSAWESRLERYRKAIQESQWRRECKTAAVRFYKAFSNPNLEESFLDGWRLFENISGSRTEKVSDQIVRASNIFERNVEYQIIGRHLSHRRNRIAHGHALKVDDEETLAFQMLRFVAPFLERYILNGFKFGSQQEFWEFLALPAQRSDREAIKAEHERQLGLLAKAAKFRRE